MAHDTLVSPTATSPPGTPVNTRRRRRRFDPWLLLFALPGLALFLLFEIWPLIRAFANSLYSWDGFTPKVWVGLGNYQQIWHASLFWSSAEHTAVYAVGTVVAKLVLGLALALLVNLGIRGLGLYRSVLFFPVLMSFVAVGLLWTFVFDPQLGLANAALKAIGIPAVTWLASSHTALPSIMLVDVWKWAGYHLVLFLAGLQTIRPELKEAAKVDGAGAWAGFWHVTLPALRPMVVLNMIIALAGALNVFDLVYVMTKGGPYHSTDTIMTYMYDQAFNQNKYGYASAVACLLFVVVALITLLQARMLRSDYDN
jgi:raffinose/stachyose/melibiose transport system permease protein